MTVMNSETIVTIKFNILIQNVCSSEEWVHVACTPFAIIISCAIGFRSRFLSSVAVFMACYLVKHRDNFIKQL